MSTAALSLHKENDTDTLKVYNDTSFSQRFNNNVFHPRRLASLKTNNDDSIYVHQKYDDVNFHIKYDFIE